ncbi:MAG: dihydropteroate synthase [Bacteroidales bacterium]|nr:dihydropteroate synthase [Bacteroidales bacterium]
MDTDRQIDIMGIINVNDDSYFSQSRCPSVEQALSLAARYVREGAAILDIGACSTRPGSLPVGADVEWERLKPVLKAVRESFPDVRISVDTYWADVVRKTYDLIGDFIVNDISAGEDDPAMLPVVGSLGLEYVAMHKRGNPMTMHNLTQYEDVVGEVDGYFDAFALKAGECGIARWILDPGFGFAKTVEQNFEMLRRLGELVRPGKRVLVGISRKSFIYKTLGSTPEDSLPATQALHLQALLNGADILRVHDVAEAMQIVTMYRRLA